MYLYMHFGLVCKSWSHLNTFNGGTRTKVHPEGGAKGPILPREQLGNDQATMICRLCMLLHSRGFHFTIENPLGSYVWLFKPMQELIAFLGSDCVIVDFDQCYFGLQLPGAGPQYFCQKSTRLLGNIPALQCLSHRCPGKCETHIHDHAFGSATVETSTGRRTLSKAGAAGIYPVGLCRPWARAAARFIKDKFWRGEDAWCGH